MNWDLVILIMSIFNLGLLAVLGFNTQNPVREPGTRAIRDFCTVFNLFLIGAVLYRIYSNV